MIFLNVLSVLCILYTRWSVYMFVFSLTDGFIRLTFVISFSFCETTTATESTRLFFQAPISSHKTSAGSDSVSVSTRKQTLWQTTTGTLLQMNFFSKVGHNKVETISSILNNRFLLWFIRVKMGSITSPS